MSGVLFIQTALQLNKLYLYPNSQVLVIVAAPKFEVIRMTGMSMMSGIYDSSGYNNRIVMIETTGFCQPNARTSVTTLKVSYQHLSRTMQRIHRQGGKVTQIRVLSGKLEGQIQPAQLPQPVAQTVSLPTEKAPTRRSPKPKSEPKSESKPAAEVTTTSSAASKKASAPASSASQTSSKTRRKSKR
jgi:hypothetical protein